MENGGDGPGRVKILKRGATKVRTDEKVLVFGDAVQNENLSAITEKTWPWRREERSEREKRDERGCRVENKVEDGDGEVYTFDDFVVRGRLSLGSLAIVCLEESIGMLVDVSVTKVESPEAADVMDVMVEKKGFENVYVGGMT